VAVFSARRPDENDEAPVEIAGGDIADLTVVVAAVDARGPASSDIFSASRKSSLRCVSVRARLCGSKVIATAI
jgi:hypothetical protein